MAKVKRRNQVKKMLFFYKTNFGFEPPYKVLIDGTFCKEALVYKVNIREQLPKYLEADARLLTTACAKAECEKYGSTYGKEYTYIVRARYGSSQIFYLPGYIPSSAESE